MSSFDGFSPDAFRFFADLEANNNREFWQANKQRWERSVREPMQAFLAALPDPYQPFHVFRMNRDVRFSADKSPYKTMHGALSERDGAVHYVHLSATGLLAAAGCHILSADQLERFRTAVADDRLGAELESIVDTLRSEQLDIGPGLTAPLKTAPRGYAADHPRIELLRWKGAMASREWGVQPGLETPGIVDDVAAFWRSTAPLNAWLERNVGPAQHFMR